MILFPAIDLKDGACVRLEQGDMTRATVFQRDPALVIKAASRYPARVAGWAETSELSALDIAKRFEDAGVAALIHTDISRDGVLAGLNLDAAIALAETVSIPVIASGGLASIADVAALLQPCAKKLAGAIAGRALYDGRLDPKQALRLIRAARAAT